MKMRTDGNQRHFNMNFHIKDGLGVEFTAC